MILQVDAVRCPLHGNLLPEMVVTPFSIDDRLLALLPFACGPCYFEEGPETAMLIDVDSHEIDEPLPQHWGDVGHDPDANPSWYPIWHARPVAHTLDGDPIFRLGEVTTRAPLP